MELVSSIFWIFIASCLLGLGAMRLTMGVGRCYRIEDHSLLSPHKQPLAVRLGGLGIASTVLAMLLLLWLAGKVDFITSPLWIEGVLPGLALILLVGLIDDIWGVMARWKLIVEIVAVSMVLIHLPIHSLFTLNSKFTLFLGVGYLAAALWMLTCINAMNLIDGLDGLAGGIALIALVALAVVSCVSGVGSIGLVSSTIAGATAAFLFYNFRSGRLILGDTGSLLLGYLISILILLYFMTPQNDLLALLPLTAISLPLLDLSLTVFRRYLKSAPLFASDFQHVHHRLLKRFGSPRKVVIILLCLTCTSVAIVLGIIFSWPSIWSIVMGILATIALTSPFILAINHNRIKKAAIRSFARRTILDNDRQIKACIWEIANISEFTKINKLLELLCSLLNLQKIHAYLLLPEGEKQELVSYDMPIIGDTSERLHLTIEGRRLGNKIICVSTLVAANTNHQSIYRLSNWLRSISQALAQALEKSHGMEQVQTNRVK